MADTAVPDLLGMTLGHRLMRTDLHRLADVAERIAEGRSACSAKRAAATARWVTLLCAEIHHHHRSEDADLWPLLTARAAEAVDVSELIDDHRTLDPLLDAAAEAAEAFAVAPAGGRLAAAATLAMPLARARDVLAEHLDAEEAAIFPVIEKYVSAAEWKKVEDAVRKSGPGPGTEVRFLLPRIVDVATPEEFTRLRALAGPVLMIVLAFVRPGHRRRERLVFGSVGAEHLRP